VYHIRGRRAPDRSQFLWRRRHQRGTIAAAMEQSVLAILLEMAPSTR
jgi:hypothetical protein